MSMGIRFAALFAARLLACLVELRDVIVTPAGAAIEKRRAPPTPSQGCGRNRP
jgi:hypothetical protein